LEVILESIFLTKTKGRFTHEWSWV